MVKKMNFGIFSTFYVGIDIGRYKIEGIKIKKSGKNLQFINQVSVPYSTKVFDGDETVDENEIILSLEKVGKTLKVDVEDFIVTSIFNDKVLFRQMKMPKMTKKNQIIDATKFQIVKELSISSANITVDVDILEETDNLSVSAFIVRNEDIEKFKSFFLRAGLPMPDILDAGYFKFNYLVENKLGPGISFLAFEDNASTYIQLFKDGKFIAIDSIPIGTNEFEENNPSAENIHYLQLSDEVQRLVRMLISRKSLQAPVNNVICVSEKMEYVDEWVKNLKEADIGNVSSYCDFVGLKKDIPAGAYSLAMRGVIQNAKG
jgi:Tfp pilus assembly PilM family ATPase